MLAITWDNIQRALLEEPMSFVIGGLIGIYLRGRFMIVKTRPDYQITKKPEETENIEENKEGGT